MFNSGCPRIRIVKYVGIAMAFIAMFGNGAGIANGGVLQTSGKPSDMPAPNVHTIMTVFLRLYRFLSEARDCVQAPTVRLCTRGGPAGGCGGFFQFLTIP